MPRAIWCGPIAFGLVNIPVRMYSAIDEKDIRFHLVHEKDDGPIGYEKICKTEEKPVPNDEIVKAYEQDGEYVYVTDEDFEVAEERGYRAIDIQDFVPFDDIDPIYFERTYYLGPQEGAENVYRLLVKAMEESGLAGIAKYVMRSKQHLGCLRVRDGAITLEKMYFADEIRPIDEIDPGSVRVSKDELEIAADLIDRFAGPWKPDRYRDTYRDRLLEVIKAKGKGKEVAVEEAPEPEQPEDLLEALRASVESAKKKRKRPSSSRSNRSGGARKRKRPATRR